MRIIAGYLGGRTFESPRGHRTHPMADKVRGALFNALGDIDRLTVLDAFAGSGALGFEAISRGAKHATAIDIDKSAVKTITRTVQDLGIHESIKVIRANAGSWSDNNPALLYDIVIAAPPYNDLRLQIVQKLARHVSATGLFVLDWPGKDRLPAIDGLRLVRQKNHGDAQLAFYKPFGALGAAAEAA